MRKTAEIFSHLLSPSSLSPSSIYLRHRAKPLFALIFASELLKEKSLVATKVSL